MGIHRIYPSKNTTILEKYKSRNTGLNPVSEVWYGGYGRSRLLVDFDVDEITTLFANKDIISGNVSSYKLILKDCSPTGSPTHLSPSNFSMEVIAINQTWDEGNGHDFIVGDYGSVIKDGFANWIMSTKSTFWSGGSFDEGYFYSAITFDHGDESITVDITKLMLSAITGSVNFYGFGIKYSADTELTFSGTNQSAYTKQFYTRHTHTVYKPYIEITFNDFVDDDRTKIISGVSSNLYAYTNKNGFSCDVYSASVEIYSGTNMVCGVTDTTVTHIATGIYCVSYLPTNIPTGTTMTDKWIIRYISGEPLVDMVGTFIITGNTWQSGTFSPAIPSDCNLLFPLIKNIYSRRDEIRFYIIPRVCYTTATTTLHDFYYRVYDDDNNFAFTDWQLVSCSSYNFFDLKFEWFYTGVNYSIQFTTFNGMNDVRYNQYIKFKVVD